MKGVGAQRTASGVSSFFFRVLLTLLAINFTTIAALIYIAYSFSTESLTQQAEDNIAQQVNILADKFDKEYRKPLNRSLRNLINAPLLDDYLLGSKGEQLILARRMERLFLQLQKDNPDFYTIFFVDSNGDIAVGVRDGRRELPQTLQTSLEEHPEGLNAAALFGVVFIKNTIRNGDGQNVVISSAVYTLEKQDAVTSKGRIRIVPRIRRKRAPRKRSGI